VGGYAHLPPSAQRARFGRDFQRTFSKPPSEIAAFTYDAMRFLLQGFTAAGAERASLRTALSATQRFDGITGRFSIGPSGDALREPLIQTISQGAIVPAGGTRPAN
jgi:branched-chain amino acid transport system substrate-binding protein